MKEVTVGFQKQAASSDTHLDLRSAFDQVESSKYELGKNKTTPIFRAVIFKNVSQRKAMETAPR